MHLRSKQLLLAASSAAVTALLAWALLGDRLVVEASTVELDDNTEGFAALLRSRQRSAPAAASDAPALPSAFAEPAAETVPRPAPEISAEVFAEALRRPHLEPTGRGLATIPAAPRVSPEDPPPLVREPISEELARETFYRALREQGPYRFQPLAHLWAKPSFEFTRPFPEHPAGAWHYRTNALGFLKDVEVMDPAPAMRIVVSGDSHTAGVVPNSESFANVLEQRLRADGDPDQVEVLNAGVGGTSMYHYLGVLEYTAELVHPAVFVVCLYGGNDFSGVMALNRFYNRSPPPAFGPHGGRRLKQLSATGVVGQAVAQVAYFLDNPDDVARSLEAVKSITVEMERLCREQGIELVFVYLPSAVAAQPERFAEQLDTALEVLAIERDDLAITDELAAQWMEFLGRRGLTCIDMTPILGASDEACYWTTDLHLNTHGHGLVAEALERVIAPLRR